MTTICRYYHLRLWVILCGRHQPQLLYHIHGEPVTTVDSFVDLGVRRTACASYCGHSLTVAAKASKVAGMIRRAFPSAACALRWPAFQAYVVPIIMYLCQAWHPMLKRDVLLLEKVQQRFTKSIRELSGLDLRRIACESCKRCLSPIDWFEHFAVL
jgi:hypothetical protein